MCAYLVAGRLHWLWLPLLLLYQQKGFSDKHLECNSCEIELHEHTFLIFLNLGPVWSNKRPALPLREWNLCAVWARMAAAVADDAVVRTLSGGGARASRHPRLLGLVAPAVGNFFNYRCTLQCLQMRAVLFFFFLHTWKDFHAICGVNHWQDGNVFFVCAVWTKFTFFLIFFLSAIAAYHAHFWFILKGILHRFLQAHKILPFTTSFW